MNLDAIARPDIKPAFAERNVPVAMATDENYLPYLRVVVNSILAHAKKGNIDLLVLNDGIDAGRQQDFIDGFKGTDNLSVRFVDVGNAIRLTEADRFQQTSHLSVAALFRIYLPYLLTSYDKIVYLDVDLCVCGDVADLYSTDIGDCLLGGVYDFGLKGTIAKRPDYPQWASSYGFSEWDDYINTGVVIMNLATFRSCEGMIDRLLPIAVDASRYFCDQDAINFICKGRIKHLDSSWNVLLLQSIREDDPPEDDPPKIYHYCSRTKPWSHPWFMYVNLWWNHVPYEDGVKIWRKAFGDREQVSIGDGIAASVIIPVYNARSYLTQALISYCAQTLENIEIICVDDGSTDGSHEICEKFAALDPRIRVVSQKNQGAAVARNRGIDEARGSWLFFGDADDFCKPEMLEEMVAEGDRKNADVVTAGRLIVDASHGNAIVDAGVPQKYLDAGDVADCRAEGVNVFSGLGFAPWNKLYRADFIRDRSIRYHQTPPADDVFFVLSAFVLAARIAFVGKSYYYYRSNLTTSQMGQADRHPTNFFTALLEVRDVVAKCDAKVQREFYRVAVASCFANLIMRKTAAGREAAYATIRDGGLDALRLPLVDPSSVDLGFYEKPCALTHARADMVDVIAAYYADKLYALTKRAEAAEEMLGKYKTWLDERKEKLAAAHADIQLLKARRRNDAEATNRTNAGLKSEIAKRDAILAEIASIAGVGIRPARQDGPVQTAKGKERKADDG